MLVASQKPGIIATEKWDKAEFDGCREVTPVTFSSLGSDTVRKHYTLRAGGVKAQVHALLQD
jgi:hypothetical protein